MCVIIVDNSETRNSVERETIARAIERNPHGWGMAAVYRDGRIVVRHGWKEAQAWKEWRTHRGALRVFHARISTGGEIDNDNLHPFNASTSDEERWFFHNGMIRDFPEFDTTKCDSWHLAQYLRMFPTNAKLSDELARFARANSSRFVLLNPTGVVRYGNGWIEKDGVWYSNGSAFPTTQVGKSRSFDFDDWLKGAGLPDGTIVSDSHHPGLVYDTDLKKYTNKKKPLVTSSGGASVDTGTSWNDRYRDSYMGRSQAGLLSEKSYPEGWKAGESPYRIREVGTTQWYERTWTKPAKGGAEYASDVRVDGPYPHDAVRYHITDTNRLMRQHKFAVNTTLLIPFETNSIGAKKYRSPVDSLNCIRVYHDNGTFAYCREVKGEDLETCKVFDTQHSEFLDRLEAAEKAMDEQGEKAEVIESGDPLPTVEIVQLDGGTVWCHKSDDEAGVLVNLLSIDRTKYRFTDGIVDEELTDLYNAAEEGRLSGTDEMDLAYIGSLCV